MTVYHRVTEQELLRFTQQAFEAIGVSTRNAAIIADNLVQGEIHGLPSHGVSRLLPAYLRRLRAGGTNLNPDIRVVRRQKGCAIVDGDEGPGAVVGDYAMHLAMDLAREHGSGWVAVRNSSHFGAAFLFARQALSEGMIGFAATNSVVQMAPYGGREKVLGTNPLCVAVPGGERGDIILDMATSAVARGKIQMAALEGKEIPLGWVVDENDQPTTDPNRAARLLPLGGYKGYGLALVVEILTAVLSGARFSVDVGSLFQHPEGHQSIGHFFGAIDIRCFLSLDEFKQRMDALIQLMKSVPLAPDATEILVPGEPEARKAKAHRRDGIPLSEAVLAILEGLASELGIRPLTLIA